MSSLIYLQGQGLTIDQVIDIAEGNSKVAFSDETRKNIQTIRRVRNSKKW